MHSFNEVRQAILLTGHLKIKIKQSWLMKTKTKDKRKDKDDFAIHLCHWVRDRVRVGVRVKRRPNLFVHFEQLRFWIHFESLNKTR